MSLLIAATEIAKDDSFKSALKFFGLGDWIFVVWSLVIFILGIVALTRGYGKPGEDYPAVTLHGGWASLWGACSVVFLFFGTVYIVGGILTVIANSTNLLGNTLGDRMIPQFIGQMTGVFVYLAASFTFQGSVHWAPSQVPSTGPRKVIDDIQQSIANFNIKDWLGCFLAVIALSFIAGLITKAFYGFCSLQGVTLPEEPQALVEEILHWEGPHYKLFFVWLALGVGAPLVEELAFRGTLYPSFKAWMPRGYAMVLTGMLFAIIHGSPTALLPLFAFGTFLCIVRDRFGLATCIALHALFNSHTFLWLLLAPQASQHL